MLNVLAKKQIHINQKLENIRAFGTQCMAYSAVQNGIKEFRHPSFRGFVPYMSVWGENYVLSDPITAKEDYLKATILFLSEHRKAVFCQISKDFADLLSLTDFCINAFGVENIIDLKEFKVTWKIRKCLKSYLSKLSKQGFYVFEHAPAIKKIHQINNEWLASKAKGKELRFMARPFEGITEPDVRFFYLYGERGPVGFCSFDPVYDSGQEGQIRSYSLQHLRVADGVPLGCQDYLILNALEQFKEEGFEQISLGLAPLYKRDNALYKYSSLAEKIFATMYRLNAFYNYRTIGEHKDHYKGKQVQTYIAHAQEFSLKQLSGLLKVNHLI